jgi:hypothetical protein
MALSRLAAIEMPYKQPFRSAKNCRFDAKTEYLSIFQPYPF